MSRTETSIGDQLANALKMLGVDFIMSAKGADESLHKQPAKLIAALAQSSEARLRLALIPLFLEHPEYAAQVRTVFRRLEGTARLMLQFYYSAAVWIGQKYRPNGPFLPDHFSKQLNLQPGTDPVENLRLLAERHREVSGSYVNWLSTYHQAERIWRKGLEYRKG